MTMNRMARSGIIAGALALAGAGGWILWPDAEDASTSQSITVSAVERRDLEVAVEAAGVIEPIRVVEVKSKASGEVMHAPVETGDRVAKDTLLAEIDPRDVQNALEQAEADVESARVRLSTTEANRGRMETLRGSNVVTQQEYESAIEAAASAKAAAVRAETNLQLARERRRDVVIRAPIEGTVLSRSIEIGQIIASATSNVTGGTTLFTMADLSEMQVRAKVDEMDVGQVKPGQPVKVTVEAYSGRSFEGTVLKVEPQAVVDQSVTMFPVLVRLDNERGLLRPGMNAEVSIELASRRDAVVVPNSAIVGIREVRTAASVLGLDEGEVRAAIRDAGAGDPPVSGRGPSAEAADSSVPTVLARNDAAGGTTASDAPVAAAAVGSPDCGALRRKLRDGGRDALSEAERGTLRACRDARGDDSRGDPAGAAHVATAASEDGGSGREARPAVVFVQGAAGPEPRRVILGVTDWEFTEVLRGLEVGDRVVLVSIAQHQKRQQELTDRMRQRSAMPGTGGGGRGR